MSVLLFVFRTLTHIYLAYIFNKLINDYIDGYNI